MGEIDPEYLRPDWTDKNRVHNWKNYITNELKAMWDSFSDEQKSAIGRLADGIADNEHWE